MRFGRSAVLALLALAAAAPLLRAETYYLDSVGGDDRRSGTSPQAAWRTVGRANRDWLLFRRGDDLLLKRGCEFTDATLIIRHGGTRSNPAVIGAYGQGPKPVIDGGPRRLQGGLLCITPGIGHIVIQDLVVRNVLQANESGITVGAPRMTGITISRVGVDHVGNNGIVLFQINTYVVEGCAVSDCGNSGIAVIGSASSPIKNGLIRGNTVRGAAHNDGITLHVGRTAADRVGPNHRLIDNVGSDCAEQAFDITSGSRISLVHNESFGNRDSGILIGHCADVVVDRHFSHGDGTVGVVVGEARRVRIQNSVIYDAASHQLTIGRASSVEIYQNTIIHGPASRGSIIDIDGQARGLAFKNNIVASTQPLRPERFVRYLGEATYANTRSDFSNNLYWRPDAGAGSDDRIFYDAAKGLCDLRAWALAYRAESGSAFADPRFELSSPTDFSLRPDSPAVEGGAGLGIGTDFVGRKRPRGRFPDIGAYEFEPRTEPERAPGVR